MDYLKNILNDEDWNYVINTFEEDLLLDLDEDNIKLIILFLKSDGYDFFEDITVTYLDLFILDYWIFRQKWTALKNKYGERFDEILNRDLSVLEEMLY